MIILGALTSTLSINIFNNLETNVHHRQASRPGAVSLQDHARAWLIQNYVSFRRSILPPSPTNRKWITYHLQGVRHNTSLAQHAKRINAVDWQIIKSHAACDLGCLSLTDTIAKGFSSTILYRLSFTSTGEGRYLKNRWCVIQGEQDAHIKFITPNRTWGTACISPRY